MQMSRIFQIAATLALSMTAFVAIAVSVPGLAGTMLSKDDLEAAPLALAPPPPIPSR